ncbi:MAG: outer rane biosis protein BamB [Planctomycetaceae bacterium]|nr:outer rane biosis protein BamB [Planctomycetaceae bacterium]
MGKIGLWSCLAALLIVAPLLAGTFAGKIESVDADGRTVVVEGTKKAGSRTFKISEKAAITITGKKGELADLVEGATITVTFDDKDKETATRLIAKNASAASSKKTPQKVETTKAAEKTSLPPGTGADWPCFDGSERNNISPETGLLKSWPDGGPSLAWKVSGIGEGYSAISIANGFVYTMGNVGQFETVTAIELETGRIAWQQKTSEASRLQMGNGPRGTPTVDGDQVYTLGGNGDLSCMQTKLGKPVWQINILQQFSGSNIQWGISESVLIDGDKLICTPGGEQATIVALNKKTGKAIWRCSAPGSPKAGYSSAIVADVAGVRQYIQFTHNYVMAVRAEDGTFLWSNDAAANGTANCSSPLYGQNRVFSASGYGKGAAVVELASIGGKTKAKFRYHTNKMESHHGGMLLVDGMVYGSSDPGVLRCLDLKTGDVKWENRSVGKGAITCADGHIYVRSEKGPVALVELNPEKYVETGRFEQPDRSNAESWAHPVVSHGKLFLRDQDLLLAYDVKAKD